MLPQSGNKLAKITTKLAQVKMYRMFIRENSFEFFCFLRELHPRDFSITAVTAVLIF